MSWSTLYLISILLIIPVFVYSLISQIRVNETFDKYAKTSNKNQLTGSILAILLLKKSGINNVTVHKINGKLTDCYDSRNKVIKLSKEIYDSTSISALGVCAHEVGHAIQDAKHSKLFKLRQTIIPVINFITRAYIPLILIGVLVDVTLLMPSISYYIILFSVISYGGSMIIYFVTLPLEYDASKKALKLLYDNNYLDEIELKQAKEVLKAAIHTYIAALLTSILYFLRFLSLLMYLRDDRK